MTTDTSKSSKNSLSQTFISLQTVTPKRQKLSQKQKAIHNEFQKCGKNAKQWMRKCILILPKIQAERIWEKKGFGSIFEYAAKIAGMNHSTVNEGLRILEKVQDMPKLKKVIEKKGIWAVKPVLKVATSENQEFWSNKAMVMSRGTLTVYVNDLLESAVRGEKNADIENICPEIIANHNSCGSNFGRTGTSKTAGNELTKPNLFEKMTKMNNEIERSEESKINDLEEVRERHYGNDGSNNNVGLSGKTMISVEVSQELATRIQKAKGKQSWEDLMQEFLEFKEAKEKQFQEELEAEKPEPVKTNSRYIPKALDRFVHKRARNLCEAEDASGGCTKSGAHIHHIDPFALTKEHNPDKLKLLCKDHHDIAHSSVMVAGSNSVSKLESFINSKFLKHKWAGCNA